MARGFISEIWKVIKRYIRRDNSDEVKPLIDRLEDYHLLAEGGMAKVWTAYDRHQLKDDKVAVKFPKVRFHHPDTIAYRFSTEIYVHQRLTHPNIVHFLEAGECLHPETGKKTPYILLDYIDGVTLKELLEKGQTLSEPVIWQIVYQVINALEYIHSKLFVHRNLSLTNVMVGKSGQVYLIDFGNATQVNSQMTAILGLAELGTPPFYPPSEINKSEPVGDLYSLGVLIYALYGGQLIHSHNTEEIREVIVTNIAQLDIIPNHLKTVLNSCLRGEYKSVSELRDAIPSILAGSYKLIIEQLGHLVSGNLDKVPTSPVIDDQRESITDDSEVVSFLEQAGFSILNRLILSHSTGIICESNFKIWQDISPLYVQASQLFSDDLEQFCEAAKQAYGETHDKMAIVVIDELPTLNQWELIFTWRTKRGLMIIPLPQELMVQAQIEERETEALREQIDLYVGRANLYDSRDPVADFLSFFGRRALMADLQKQLKNRSSLILYGVRKIGKTSLLIRLREESEWPVAVINLEGYSRGLGYVYEDAVRGWRKALQVKFPSLSDLHQTGLIDPSTPATQAQVFRQEVNRLLDLLADQPGRPGLLLFLDEIDILLDEPDYREFAGVLRSVTQNPRSRGRFAILMAGLDLTLNRSDHIAGGRNPFYSFFVETPVGPLGLEDARTMIVSIGGQMGVRYKDEALEMLVRAGGGHPFLTRQLCSQAIRDLERPTIVDAAQAERAIETYLREARNYLAESLWYLHESGPPPAEGALLKALATTQPLAYETLIPANLSASERRARQLGLDQLRDQSLIRQVEGGWEITIPLYRRWIRRYILNLADDTHAQER